MPAFKHLVGALVMLFVASSSLAQGMPPTFAQFPAHVHVGSTQTQLRLVSKKDREFRTKLSAAAALPVNFAGKYVLATIGCGASCVLVAAIDKTSGQVAWLPYTLCCWELAITDPVRFQPDSNLLILNGQRNERGTSGSHYVRWAEGRFIAVASDGSMTR